jgi:carbamoyl-phosphate synthase large subunit
LDELQNDITKKTPACFEPTIDYVVTKIPRFAFEKFPGSEAVLTTQMKSVGEAMAIGRTFNESFQKALRSLETGRAGWGCDKAEKLPSGEQIRAQLRTPNPERIFSVRHAMQLGMSNEEIYELTAIDPWFLDKLQELLEIEKFLKRTPLKQLTKAQMYDVKRNGFSDRQIAYATKTKEDEVRTYRKQLEVIPVYKTVDTCAAEFEALTPYYYSTYEEETEVLPTDKPKLMILGGGPNRIGQGIEFDYCCCHAAYSLHDAGYETIMVNSNPETVSTDYDTSDRLYFEPLTKEDVLNIIEAENPVGIIVQFGGQTPLKLAIPLQEYLQNSNSITKIWGTSPDSIDMAENRERFEKILQELNIAQPPNGMARSYEDALIVAKRIGYPVVVRPSYVLGGRAMEIVYSDTELERYMNFAVQVEPDHPILIDKFLENAIEVDVDAIADHTGNVVIGGIMEHIEQAGIHSGDSACSLPSISLSPAVLNQIRLWTVQLAQALSVVGLMNIQFAVVGANGYSPQVYILEANPRASRTVPFVSKATGVQLAKLASLIMSGKTLEEVKFTKEVIPSHIAVKEAVLPFSKFPGTDTILGPEMRSTGEVMGIDSDFGRAFAKAELGAGEKLPLEGTVFVSMSDRDKPLAADVVKEFIKLGFTIMATQGTRQVLQEQGLEIQSVLKLHEGRPHVLDAIKNQKIQLIINTPSGEEAHTDSKLIRRTALGYKIPIITTIAGARATAAAIYSLQNTTLDVKVIQEYCPMS